MRCLLIVARLGSRRIAVIAEQIIAEREHGDGRDRDQQPFTSAISLRERLIVKTKRTAVESR